eukprot:CAMPEP_0177614170 /NCGR_PEP_ID=MMETSP0419_2-20121207/22502_1 /TAXON_ID=582737 /ORGANISM="Tetraselmis sp., Strain GSL018" /LENGTH=52 /DNA_ID=CAMNT_0019111189 /DNA_START=74 /DNA_END=229 /DNA_ORIENTATION=+
MQLGLANALAGLISNLGAQSNAGTDSDYSDDLFENSESESTTSNTEHKARLK